MRVVYNIYLFIYSIFFFFSSRRRHTRLQGDWSSDVCSSDLSKHISGIAGSIPWVVGVVVSHGLVNEVDSEEPTRRGAAHHISVCRLNKQARGGIGWNRRYLVGLLSASKLTSRRIPRISLSSPFW